MSIFSRKEKPKQNKMLKPISSKGNDKGGRVAERVLLSIAIALCAAVLVFAVIAVKMLSRIYSEEFRLTSQDNVTIDSGKMVQQEMIASKFMLTNGVNLAEVPFAEIRNDLMKSFPLFKEITITRVLPDQVSIKIVERVPVVRLSSEGRVADAEGVVFEYYRGTNVLPMITDNEAASDAVSGNKLSGHAAAALRLILAASSKNGDAPPLHILSVDATKTDYLLLTLADYSQAMFAWPHMDDDTTASREAMLRQIGELSKAIASQIGSSGKMWNATVPGRVFCKIPELEQN